MAIQAKEEVKDLLQEESHKIVNNMEGRRFVKSHIPLSLFNPQLLDTGCKVLQIDLQFQLSLLSIFYFRLFIQQEILEMLLSRNTIYINCLMLSKEM